jgi:putative DNA primase/helicase
MITTAEIHARIGPAWPQVLARLGIPENALRNQHGPCPICGGKDRYRFDNKRLRGDYICGQCGAGDAFKLLQGVHGWQHNEARRQVMGAAGISASDRAEFVVPQPAPQPAPVIAAAPTGRVLTVRRGSCAVADCSDAVAYLSTRGLWPLPSGCSLRAHPTVQYFEDGNLTGRYPALVADVTDSAGELVTVHVTYLESGQKLEARAPRKLLGGLTGHDGCAVRLMPAGEVLGVAEGIETALSAAAIDGVPVWAALNATLLAKFDPPPGVKTLRIYADRDEAGLTAAWQLTCRLQGRVQVEACIPRAPYGDFNDQLVRRENGKGTTP